jgi:ADP-ribose pyrophosphatase YjhB (NUDIX family)
MKFQPARFCIRCGSAMQEQMRFERIRPVCPSCGWVHFSDPKVAVEILVEKEDSILLVLRLNEPCKGLWSLPGGYMDNDEDPARAAERECLEETGLRVRVTRLIDVIQDREYPNGADIVIAYAAQPIGGQLQAGDDAGEAAFFPRSVLPKIAFQVARKVIGID